MTEHLNRTERSTSEALDALGGAFELLDEMAATADGRTQASLVRRIRGYIEDARRALDD